MLKKQTLTLCVLILAFSFISVHAHMVPDPGPSIIEGDINNMTRSVMILWDFFETTWFLDDKENDSLGNVMLRSMSSLAKRLHFHANGQYWAVSGTSTSAVAAAATVSGFKTRGKYYIKASAKGGWFWWSKKESKKYENGVSRSVDKSAARYHGNPTHSGVHLWGKAEVNNQFAKTKVVFEWL